VLSLFSSSQRSSLDVSEVRLIAQATNPLRRVRVDPHCQTSQAVRFRKPLMRFKFPLEPGKTWAQNARWVTPALNVHGSEEVRAKIVGWRDR
jgi:hypothetical protein